MIDHVSVAVSDLRKASVFFQKVLAPLGMKQLVNREHTTGFGKSYPEFWLNARPDMNRVSHDSGNHIALRAASEEAVVAFHKAAIANGGSEAGAPGMLQGANTVYFGAFIFDPDGNRIEAVTFPRKQDR